LLDKQIGDILAEIELFDLDDNGDKTDELNKVDIAVKAAAKRQQAENINRVNSALDGNEDKSFPFDEDKKSVDDIFG
jgi:hypothetical protein